MRMEIRLDDEFFNLSLSLSLSLSLTHTHTHTHTRSIYLSLSRLKNPPSQKTLLPRSFVFSLFEFERFL